MIWQGFKHMFTNSLSRFMVCYVWRQLKWYSNKYYSKCLDTILKLLSEDNTFFKPSDTIPKIYIYLTIKGVCVCVTLVTLVNSLSLDWSCLSMTAGLPREVTAWRAWSPPDAECYLIQRPLSQSNLHLLVDLALFSTSHPSVVWRYPVWYPSGFLCNPGYYWISFVSFWMGSCIFVFFLHMTNVSRLPCLVLLGI